MLSAWIARQLANLHQNEYVDSYKAINNEEMPSERFLASMPSFGNKCTCGQPDHELMRTASMHLPSAFTRTIFGNSTMQ